MKFIEISSDEQKEILGYVQENTGLKSAIIEKDWWATAVLRAIFMLPYSKHIIQGRNKPQQMLGIDRENVRRY